MVVYSRKPSSDSIISYLNVDNAKKLALALVLGFICYHGILHLRFGPDSCTWLLSSGRYKGDHEWQPYGCMLHRYSKTDARRCFRYLAFWGKYNSFVFIGDARLKQLYKYFIDLLKTESELDKSFSMMDQHSNNDTYVEIKLQLSVHFIWSDDVSRAMVEHFKTWQFAQKPPTLIIASTGLNLIRDRNATAQVLTEYKTNLTRLVQAIDSLTDRGTNVLWKLMEPVDVGKVTDEYKMITNNDIDAFNKAAVEILTHSATKIWSSPRLVSQTSLAEDGRSLSPLALRHSAQILLNMHCNDNMNYDDGSCCAQPEKAMSTQLVTLVAFVLFTVLALAKHFWKFSQTIQPRFDGYNLISNNSQNKNKTACVYTAIAKLGLIMGYFYLCDRTNFFMKENKYYSEWSFWLPVGYVFALGLFFTEESNSTRLLHRSQTYELKGCLQAVILIYRVTGAARVLAIRLAVRAAAATYLFLTGYGHAHYTLTTADTSVVRYFRVMFRLNFLTVVLCLTMNRPYQFYSFVPLVSFWYTLMFIIFWLPPHLTPASSHNAESKPYQYLYITIKILGLLTIVTVLYMSEVFFQKIFVTRPWKALFVNSDDDIHQWWLMWKQDRYSLAYGIIFAIPYILAQRYNLLDDSNHSNLFKPGLTLISVLLGLLGLGGFVMFTIFCNNFSACSEVHSYIAFIPIVSYIVLRNVSGALRTRHSSLFAWFGTFTLELFVSQSHIWLAADTHGVLVLIPGAPVLNLMLTSYIFICTAHELHKLTDVILPYAVPDDWRLVLRNFVIFLAVLIPIGIHDGMF